MKTKIIKVLVATLIVSTTLIFGGCGQSKEVSSKTNLEKIKESGKIVLGTSADYPPYEFHKNIDGKDTIVGFDINIAEEIASDLGVELEIKDMKFDGLLAALQTGNIDFIIAGMTPDEQREKSVDFSNLYYEAEQKLLVKKGEAAKYQSIDDLKGLKIGAQKATVQEKIAMNKIENADVKSLSKITDLVLELKNNKIDGIVLVKPVAEAYANASDDLEVVDILLDKEEGVAIAVKKNSIDLLNSINDSLDKLINEDKIDQFIEEATKIAE